MPNIGTGRRPTRDIIEKAIARGEGLLGKQRGDAPKGAARLELDEGVDQGTPSNNMTLDEL